MELTKVLSFYLISKSGGKKIKVSYLNLTVAGACKVVSAKNRRGEGLNGFENVFNSRYNAKDRHDIKMSFFVLVERVL